MRPEVLTSSRATTLRKPRSRATSSSMVPAPSTSDTRVQSVMPFGVGSPEMTPSAKRPPRRFGLRCGRPANAVPCPAADATTTPPAAARKLRRDTASPGVKARPDYLRPPGSAIPQKLNSEIFTVVVAIIAAAVEHVLHVRARLGEGHVRFDLERVDPTRLGDPFVDVPDSGVVCRQRRTLVAVVVVEQVAQEVGAIGDVDLRRGEVGLLEQVAARMLRDEIGGVG